MTPKATQRLARRIMMQSIVVACQFAMHELVYACQFDKQKIIGKSQETGHDWRLAPDDHRPRWQHTRTYMVGVLPNSISIA